MYNNNTLISGDNKGVASLLLERHVNGESWQVCVRPVRLQRQHACVYVCVRVYA